MRSEDGRGGRTSASKSAGYDVEGFEDSGVAVPAQDEEEIA
jgi:hypothetical protein